VNSWAGTVRALFVAPVTEAPMESRDEVRLVAGVGIPGDRYAAGEGHFSSQTARSGDDLTLIEEEAIEAVRRDYAIDLDLGAPRRNVVTSGVPLNHLVGKEFRVGSAVVRGVELCEPCTHVAKLIGIPRVRQALVHRGGLRADVLSGGVMRVGDPIAPT
jgi:MOSC domain-containing protein YiiM